jgi:hypothetical protein
LIIVIKSKPSIEKINTNTLLDSPSNSIFTNAVSTLTIPTPRTPIVPNITSVKPTKIINSVSLAASAAAKADDKIYNDFQALVKRAQLRSGPTQTQQWLTLLDANIKGLIPDSSFTADQGNIADSNLANDIALNRSGVNYVSSRTRILN